MNIYYLTRVMKIIMLLLLAGFLTVNASSYSQQVTLKGKNIPFSTVIDAIRKQSGYTVFGNKKLLNDARPVTIDVKDMPLADFMEAVTENQPISYIIQDRIISLSEKAPVRVPLLTPAVAQQQQFIVSGIVRHAETKELLQAVSVQVKGTTTGTRTNAKGEYRLAIPAADGKQVIVFTYVGMQKLEVPFRKQEKLDVELQPDEQAMNEVVITGIYQRERQSFTGSSSRFSAKELKAVGNQNILQSLKTLDPSFAIIENTTFGSDPNRLPDIEIRGKSSVIGLTDQYSSNPNQPLFILDGFESTLSIISDLSMDRVESITLLKDASATAIYGSKAANGVVVVETKRPQPGQLRINYTLNGTVSYADLTDYNLMDAEEKLQFEYLSGHYGRINDDGNFTVSMP